jgi:hypothetical protein
LSHTGSRLSSFHTRFVPRVPTSSDSSCGFYGSCRSRERVQVQNGAGIARLRTGSTALMKVGLLATLSSMPVVTTPIQLLLLRAMGSIAKPGRIPQNKTSHDPFITHGTHGHSQLIDHTSFPKSQIELLGLMAYVASMGCEIVLGTHAMRVCSMTVTCLMFAF